MVATAINVAQYFLSLAADEPEAEHLTPMHIQKLLYYAQGFSLTYRDRPLFPEVIEAWTHGPVVPEVYREFAHLSGGPIMPDKMRAHHLSGEDQEFVSSVWEEYRKHSASALRAMTHNEPPWRDARRGLQDNSPSSRPMTNESIKHHFDAMCDREMQEKSGVSLPEMLEAKDDAAKARTSPWGEVKQRVGKPA